MPQRGWRSRGLWFAGPTLVWGIVAWGLLGPETAIVIGIGSGLLATTLMEPRWEVARSFVALRVVPIGALVAYTALATVRDVSTSEVKHWGLVVATLGATIVVLYVGGVWTRWIFWRRREVSSIWMLVFATIAAGIITTDFVTIVSAYAEAHRWLAFGPYVPTSDVVRPLFESYSWDLSDSVPALDIPKSLHWAKPNTFTSASTGAVLIAYKLTVIVLIGNLITDIGRLHGERTRSSVAEG